MGGCGSWEKLSIFTAQLSYGLGIVEKGGVPGENHQNAKFLNTVNSLYTDSRYNDKKSL